MRQYLLDEIRKPDIDRIRHYLDEHAICAGLEGIWWIELQQDQLNETQYTHPDCQPFCFAIELGDDFVKFELLIRSRKTMRCSCIGYATNQQRESIMGFADQMLAELNVKT